MTNSDICFNKCTVFINFIYNGGFNQFLRVILNNIPLEN